MSDQDRQSTEDESTGDGSRKPRLLMLTHRLPYPPDRGDRIRSYNLLKQLSQHFELAVASVSEDPIWLQHHQLLASIAKRVALYPVSNLTIRINAVKGLLTGRAITPSCFFRQGLCDQILRWQEEDPFDAVLTFCTGMIEYVRRLRNHRPKPFTGRHVLDLVDVDSAKWQAYAGNSWFPMSMLYRTEARRLRRIERGEYEPFDALTVVSEAEAEAYRRTVGPSDRVHAVGNGVDLQYFHPLPEAESPTLCFVGVLNYRPNAEGITWFAREVMPLLHERRPDIRLLVVGRHPTSSIEELGRHPAIEIVGSVPDVRAYIREAGVVIAPLKLARGVQNKVLEAMACKRVAMCSPAAAEGLDADPEQEMVVADKAEEWVERIIQLLDDVQLNRKIAEAARRRVERAYSWESRLEPMIRLLNGQSPLRITTDTEAA
ncbi:MAG: TIGR03087 family PEP-CTERM/XrtA system glycosyltransferase [Phycisphaeraceae bacterium]|nr:TIGR03087 family PEP-CTERM/XrtA system glycosyltransferase [Phycisphaeraceae bacterium]